MGIYVKFTKTTHKIWPCHVILASNSENFYFSPNFVLNFKKVTKFGRNWPDNKNVTGKKQIGDGNTPPPSVLIGLNYFVLFMIALGVLLFNHTTSCLLL